MISETWFNPYTIQDVSGYEGFHTLRSTPTGRGGGISIYSKPEFSPRSVDEISYCNSTIEVNTIEISRSGLNLFVIGIYRPHEDNINNFIDTLLEILNNPLLRGKMITIVGDLNINILNTDGGSQDFINALRSLHFLPLIDKPTRFSTIQNHSPSLLDQIWCNRIYTFVPGIISLDVTDHCPIFLFIPLPGEINSNGKIEICFRRRNDENLRNFSIKIQEFDWNSIYSSDVSVFTRDFISKLDRMYSSHFPLVKKTISLKRANKPWLNSDIYNLVKLKSEFFSLSRSGLVTPLENNVIKNRLNSKIRSVKRNYFNKLFSDCVGNMRKTWININYLISRTTNRKTIKSIIVNNIECFEQLSIAKIFNDYFSEIPGSVISNIPVSDIDPLSYLTRNPASIIMHPTNTDEIGKVINSMKNTKSDINSFPLSLLKFFGSHFAKIISDIINLCFNKGKFPECLKCSYVTPIHKKGDPKLVSNYRPISIISYFSKIIEKCILIRFNSFITNCGILTDNQYGFRKNMSTQDAIIKFFDFIYNALDQNKHAVAIFIDYQKAFDLVDHQILYRKLNAYGIRGTALELVTSYLTNRRQHVRIGDSISNEKIINMGVPQGSNIGPLFFLLYINDLVKVFSDMSAVLFADDTTLLIKDDSLSKLVQRSNSELVKFKNWNVANRLSLNVSKTSVMLFSNRTKTFTSEVILYNNQALNITENTVFLGLRIDSQLKFNLHINHVCGKVSKTIGVLYRIRDLVPKNIMIKIYYSLIYPYLMYCCPIWARTYASHLEPLVLLQKRAIRIINGSTYFAHTNPLFLSLNILKLNDVAFYFICVHMYKNLDKYDTLGNHGYNTRNASNLRSNFHRLTSSQRSFDYIGPTYWNKLPVDIRRSNKLSSFKFNLKKYLISRYEDLEE